MGFTQDIYMYNFVQILPHAEDNIKWFITFFGAHFFFQIDSVLIYRSFCRLQPMQKMANSATATMRLKYIGPIYQCLIPLGCNL